LQRLHAAGHTITLVLTQPDRPAGRGMKLQASAVKQFALQHGLPIAQPRSLRLDGKYPEDARAARAAIAQADAEVMVVAAYGLILPQWVLQDMSDATQMSADGPPLGARAPLGGSAVREATSVGAKYGCINIHGSLLPRWRGAAPIHRAIEAGDTETGITIMQMDAGLDTGDMLLMQSTPIGSDDTTASLHDRLAELGGELIVSVLDRTAKGQLQPIPQSAQGVTYANKIEKQEAAIDWAQSAAVILRRVRAFNPFPVAKTRLAGEDIKVWRAHAGTSTAISALPLPGTIVAVTPAGIAVAAMNSIVILTELQRAGGKRLAVADFLHGFDLQVGMRMHVEGDGAPATAPLA
jgi:methionyl-tRNA formyltransferase